MATEFFSSDQGRHNTAREELPDASPIHRLIHRTRRLLRITWVSTGLAVTICLCITALLVVTLTDLAVALWPAFRLLGLLLIVVPAAWVFCIGVLRPLFRRLPSVAVAHRIESEIPGMHNRLVSCVDLSTATRHRFHSIAFYRRLIAEAIERIRGFRPSQVLDLITLRRASVFSIASVFAFLLSFWLFSDRLPTAMARIFRPFADIPPASGVVYDVFVGDEHHSGDYETLRGDDVTFTVILRKGQVDPPGGADPLRLVVTPLDGQGQHQPLQYEFAALEDQQTSFTLTGMQHSFSYRVYGGGTWSKQHKVTMIDRPRIVALQTVLHYPKYMRMPEPRVGAPQTADVTGPVGSTVQITVDVEGDASEGEIQLLQPTTRTVDVVERPQRVWISEDVPQGAARDGNWQFDEQLMGKKGHFNSPAAGVHQHGFYNAPIAFEVQPGESLFAEVFLPADQKPESIMLKWHDGQNWEHRAFWGEDKIAEGQLDSPSRRRAGDIPELGKLVRLEIPAKDVDMEGRRIHGMMFTLHGGHAVWGSVGAMPAATREVQELVVTESSLLKPVSATEPQSPSDVAPVKGEPQQWTGHFTLNQNGYYRVVLRNRLKHPNPEMQPGKLIAIPDNLPEIALERPAADLIVSTPIKVPLYLSAHDDFGIDAIELFVKRDDQQGFNGRPVKTFDPPKRSDTAMVVLDLEQEKLTIGHALQYRVQVRDTKGQSATTRDFSIRFADDGSAVDRQVAQFEQQTESLQKKLGEMVAEQNKVQEAIEKTTEQYQELEKTIEAAVAEATPPQPADPAQPTPQPPPVTLPPETTNALNQLKNELNQLAAQQDQNVQRSQQAAAELQALANQAPNLATFPREITEQLQNVQRAFEPLATRPMQGFSEALRQTAQPQTIDPQLEQLSEQGESVQQNLEDLQARIDAIANAQKQSRTNVDQAVTDLRRDLLQQDAELTARELAGLSEFVADLREDLNALEEDQSGLIEDAEAELSDRLFGKLEEEQQDLNVEAEPKLAQTAELLDQLEQLQQASPFPNSSGDSEPENGPMPPNEEGAPESAAPMDDQAGDQAHNETSEAGQEEPARFRPALDGPQPKLDPRVAEKLREAERQAQNPQASASERERAEFRAEQLEQLVALDSAAQALGADQQSLERMLAQLSSEQTDSPEQASELAELMRSEDLQQARQMLARMQQLARGQQSSEQPLAPPNQNPTAQAQPAASQLLRGSTDPASAVDQLLVELEDLDLETRTMIMRMQPQVREELLQSLREEGPEGYRTFIREYFRRLSQVQPKQ